MKKLLTSLVVLFVSVVSYSQTFTTTQPDTVCFGSTTPSTYQVANIGSGTYTWTIPACASIVSGQGTNQIQVNWSNCPAGLIPNAVSVVGGGLALVGPAVVFSTILPSNVSTC